MPATGEKGVTSYQVTLISHQKFGSILQNESDAAGVQAFSEGPKIHLWKAPDKSGKFNKSVSGKMRSPPHLAGFRPEQTPVFTFML